MAVKDWFRKLQPFQLYAILILTFLFFLTELVVSHLTHALTLLMDSYHMLCNIMALTGCIITIKYGVDPETQGCDVKKTESVSSQLNEEIIMRPDNTCSDIKEKKSSPSRNNREKKLKNTFGWTRIDVITMLICCVFLASFSFSIYIEAFQTLIHIDHQDEMHHPLFVLCVGAIGLILNGLCYLLIGGYTFHQGSFLYVTESGDVILNKVVVNESVQRGERRLSRTRNIHSTPPRRRQGLWEMFRDIAGCSFVMICSLGVLFIDKELAKFVDPAFALLSATTIMVLSIPYMKESCLILLQTIPDTINIDSMKADLVTHFPDIINVHDFHIWQLTASKIVSTVHIIFENPKVYKRIMEEIKEFFLENGVTHVTIQPEFFSRSLSIESLSSAKFPPKCLVTCLGEICKKNHCCPRDGDLNKLKSRSKEVLPLPENTVPTLKSIKLLSEDDDQLPVAIHTENTEKMVVKDNHELKEENIAGKSQTQPLETEKETKAEDNENKNSK